MCKNIKTTLQKNQGYQIQMSNQEINEISDELINLLAKDYDIETEEMKQQKLRRMERAFKQALFDKYSAKENRHLTKDINDMILKRTTPATILLRDIKDLANEEELLKKVYPIEKSAKKLGKQIEYWKFHTDCPRMYDQIASYRLNKVSSKKECIRNDLVIKLLEEDEKKG